MNILEKEIEDLIYDTIMEGNSILLAERGLPFDEMEIFGRQVNLGKYGILDLVGLSFYRGNKNSEVDVYVIEIKRGEINVATYLQAIRYCKALSLLFKKTSLTPIFHQILIGTSVNKDDFIYLPDINDSVRIYTMKVSLEKGVTFFNECGYQYSNYDFNVNDDVLRVFKNYIKDQIADSVNEKREVKDFFNQLEINAEEN